MNCKYCRWCGTINNLEWICNNSNSEKFNKELTVRLSRHTIKSGCSQYSELTGIKPMPENYIQPKTEVPDTNVAKQLEESVKNTLDKAVKYELERANSLYPQFHSAHEAESVLREELEECVDELDELTANFEAYWNKIKSNNVIQQKIGLNQLKQCAEKLAIEVNQFRAMCEKAQAFYDKEGVE